MKNSSDVGSDARPYRMIAIDMDGTLLSPTGEVTPRTREAVQNVLSAGFVVCFATGRNWTESERILDAVGHHDYAVFVGGAMVVDTRRRLTVHRTIMQPELAAEVCDFFEIRGHATLALQDTGAAGVDYLISQQLRLDDQTEMWMRVAKAKVQRVPNLGSYAHQHTIRVGVVAVPTETAKMVLELREMFGDRIVCHSIAVMDYGVDVLEVFDPAVTKWQGLLLVASAKGIDPSQIIAIGDELNDLPMISQAGLGVAMGNARPQVKAAASRVIGPNSEDGLAKFLEELVTAQKAGRLVE
jgi:Cof subfamily protein (haloacid dehalogenase superfamily)